MKLICRIDVATIKDTGNEAIMPATDERKPTSREVLKKRYAMAAVRSHPTVPLESAANCFLTIRKTMTRIGSSVRATDKSIISSWFF
jgi:hypothetical protein